MTSNAPPDHPTIYFNGIDGDDGDYLLAPRSLADLTRLLPAVRRRPGKRKLAFDQSPGDLASVGWGVVWPEGADDERRRLLRPLIALRSDQMGCQAPEFEVFPGESWPQFRERHGAAHGTLDTDRLPYHLLLVASPEEIPFDFQSAMSVPHSVGRLHFDDLPDLDIHGLGELEAHIAALLHHEERHEASTAEPRRRAALFGVCHPDDPLTHSAVEHLVKGLDGELAQKHPDWEMRTVLRRAADKAQLLRLVQPDELPSLLFTAGHGIGYRPDSWRQASRQGALLCADYPGPQRWDRKYALPDDFLLTARDLRGHDLSGLISCHFACYSLGTEELDLYSLADAERKAHRPFVSPLPQTLLGRGALGVIGHVGVTLEQSYLWYSAGPQIKTFSNVLREIFMGQPIGHALDHISCRHSELASEIAHRAGEAMGAGDTIESLGTLRTWSAHEDARHFMLLGDPAARLHG